jgi:hypothetical protein
MAAALLLAGCPDEEDVEKECTDCLDKDGYLVEFPDPGIADRRPMVLFNGYRNGRCQQDVVCYGTPDLFLGDLRWGPDDWGRDCSREELVAFAVDHAPFIVPLVPGATGHAVTFASAPVVDVTIRLIGAVHDPALEAQAYADAERATRLFSELGAGIALKFTVQWLAPPPLPIPPGETVPPKFEQSAGCDNDRITALLSTAAAGGYDSRRINVYYVTSVAGNRAAVTCYGPPSLLHQEIVLMQGGLSYSPMQLGHELGHALGLLRTVTTPAGNDVPLGHVDEMGLDEYLRSDNLMYSGGFDYRTLTIGQVYRMHFDDIAWLMRGTPSPPYPRTCQASPVASGGPCPPLTLNPLRGWP